MPTNSPHSIVEAVLILADSAQINVNPHLSLSIDMQTYLNSIREFPEISLEEIEWNANELECIKANCVYAVTVFINGNQRTAVGPTVDVACSRVASFLCCVIDATSKSKSVINNKRAVQRKTKDKFLVSYLKAGGLNMDRIIELELFDASIHHSNGPVANCAESEDSINRHYS